MYNTRTYVPEWHSYSILPLGITVPIRVSWRVGKKGLEKVPEAVVGIY